MGGPGYVDGEARLATFPLNICKLSIVKYSVRATCWKCIYITSYLNMLHDFVATW